MHDNDLETLRSGQLWRDFCAALADAGEQILGSTVPQDDLTSAEGLRYLTRLLRLSLEKNIEFADPNYPQFYSLSHETAKIGNDNPDNFYQNCAVDGRREYRIRGNRGSVSYLSIETKAGSFAGGGDMAPTGHVELEQLQVDENGDFELMVSARQYPGNWLRMTPESDNLLVRQTFRDRASERRAELHIECLDPVGSDTLNAAEFINQMGAVVPFVSGTAGLFKQWMDDFSGHINQLPANDQAMCLRAGGDPAIFYHNSYWQLSPEQALVIEFMPPAVCRTWNFQLSNYWMESLDYRYHRISINKDSAVCQADGSVRIVVAAADPGHPNWLSTTGHECGAMLLRYVESSEQPPVHTAVVPLAQLRDDLSGNDHA